MKADKGQNMQSNKGHVVEFHSSQGNQRPRRQDYQADWTYADSLDEYADSLVAQVGKLTEALEAIQSLPDHAEASAAKHLADIALPKVAAKP